MTKSSEVVFRDVTLRPVTEGVVSSNLKEFAEYTVSADKRSFYIGPGANYSVSWKTVEDLQLSDEGMSLTSSKYLVECRGPTSSSAQWRSFVDFVQRRWNKRQAKMDIDVLESLPQKKRSQAWTSGTATSQRRVYGKRQRATTSYSRPTFPVKDHWESDGEDDGGKLKEADTDGDINDDIIDYDDPVQDSKPVEVEQVELVAPSSRKRHKQKRLLPLRQEERAEDSDDDDLFDNTASTTILDKQRVVTPHSNAVIDDDDEEAEEEENIPSSTTKGMSKIDSFFRPSTASSKPSKKSPAPLKLSTTNLPKSPTPFKRTTTPSRSLTPTRRPLDSNQNKEWVARTPSKSSVKKTPLRDFPSDDEEVDSPPPSLKRTFDKEDQDKTPTRASLGRYRRFAGRKCGHKGRTLLTGPSTADAALDNTPSSRRLQFASLTKSTPRVNPYNVTPIKKAPLLPAAPTCPWRGLRNLGNTCYLNSSLQMLMSVSGFLPLLDGLGGDLSSSLVAILKSLKESNNEFRAADPRDFKAAIDSVTDKFFGYEQRDAHEFLSELIDRVHDELIGNKENNKDDATDENSKDSVTAEPASQLPTDMFRLNVEVCLKCDSCGYERTKKEMYRHLSLDIDDHAHVDVDNEEPQRWSIEKGLAQFFRPEKREVKCEKCSEGKSATQTLRILSRPKVLLLHLKRFVLVEKPRIRPLKSSDENKSSAENDENSEEPKNAPPVEMTFRKNKAPVTLNEHVSLNQFVAKSKDESDAVQSPGVGTHQEYTLKSVVHHIGGTAFSGHYTADSMRAPTPSSLDEQVKWFAFDDGSTCSTSAEKVRNSERSQRTAYMVLYTVDES